LSRRRKCGRAERQDRQASRRRGWPHCLAKKVLESLRRRPRATRRRL